MKNLKILIISTFFEKKYQYMEVQLADTLSKLGHDVVVLTSDRSPFQKRKRVADFDAPYRIIRLSKFIRVTNTLFPMEDMSDLLKEIGPDIAFLIYPNHGLPYFLSKYLPEACKVVSTFEDRTDKNRLSMKTRLIKIVIKQRWYKHVFRRSSLIAAVTNETADIFRKSKYLRNSLDDKLKTISLGYNPEVFYHDHDLRNTYRLKYNISPEKIVLITITRVTKDKPIVQWIAPIARAMKVNKKLIYFLAGFSKSRYSAQIKETILSSDVSSRFILLDFVTSEEMNGLFNAADYSVWFSPSIAIQQSMGTGLFTVVPERRTLDHLIQDSTNGVMYGSFDDLYVKLSCLEGKAERQAVFEYNKRFSYKNIIDGIITEVGF